MKKIAKVLTFGFLAFACVSPSFGQLETAKSSTPDTPIEEELRSYVPAIHDDLIMERLKCLEKSIPLTYHHSVRKQIERFMVKERSQVQYYLMRKDRYFPIFEETLARYGLPDELKYLAVVESALIPKAQSWASAVGLWQFMPFTGREYGLAQDFYVDERIDPYKSTEAAAKFLKFLYQRFGDWHLALAAYNSGPGRVDQAIKRSGGKRSFWEIYPYLPNETKAYVPIFIAVNYVFNYHHEHFTDMPKEVYTHIPSDTIQVNQYVNLKELAKQLDVDFEVIQILNPHLKKNVVPKHYKNYPIRIPKEKFEYFVANRDSIMAEVKKGSYQFVPYPNPQNNWMLAANTKGKKKVTHIVKPNENLAIIAKEYNVNQSDLMVWNKLRMKNLYASQRLVLWIDEPKEEKTDNTEEQVAKNNASEEVKRESENKTPIKTVSNPNQSQIGATATSTKVKPTNNKPLFHTVKQGDTLWNISQKYRGLSIEKIRQLNPTLKGNNLVAGQKIRVG
jgi:membrane-bound lytic murein transglycosylase D